MSRHPQTAVDSTYIKIFLFLTQSFMFLLHFFISSILYSFISRIIHGISFGLFFCASNGGCRREEKSRKQWSIFTMLSSSVIEIFFFIKLNQKQLYVLIALKIRTEPNELDELKYSK